jgi:hypothetical protein
MCVSSSLGCSRDFLLELLTLELDLSLCLRLARFTRDCQCSVSLFAHSVQGCSCEQSRHFRHLSCGEFSLVKDEHFPPGFPGHLFRGVSGSWPLVTDELDISGEVGSCGIRWCPRSRVVQQETGPHLRTLRAVAAVLL